MRPYLQLPGELHNYLEKEASLSFISAGNKVSASLSVQKMAKQWAVKHFRNCATLSALLVAACSASQIARKLRRVKRQVSCGPTGWTNVYSFVPILSIKIVTAGRAGHFHLIS